MPEEFRRTSIGYEYPAWTPPASTRGGTSTSDTLLHGTFFSKDGNDDTLVYDTLSTSVTATPIPTELSMSRPAPCFLQPVAYQRDSLLQVSVPPARLSIESARSRSLRHGARERDRTRQYHRSSHTQISSAATTISAVSTSPHFHTARQNTETERRHVEGTVSSVHVTADGGDSFSQPANQIQLQPSRNAMPSPRLDAPFSEDLEAHYFSTPTPSPQRTTQLPIAWITDTSRAQVYTHHQHDRVLQNVSDSSRFTHQAPHPSFRSHHLQQSRRYAPVPDYEIELLELNRRGREGRPNGIGNSHTRMVSQDSQDLQINANFEIYRPPQQLEAYQRYQGYGLDFEVRRQRQLHSKRPHWVWEYLAPRAILPGLVLVGLIVVIALAATGRLIPI